MSRRIYVASSWRNEFQPKVVEVLRAAGHEVYDFKNPEEGGGGFQWSDIDPGWGTWQTEEYREKLNHPLAVDGYGRDYAAMKWANTFVGVEPFGRSASMEMGWAAGAGKETLLLLANGEPELMVKMFDHICCSLDELVGLLTED